MKKIDKKSFEQDLIRYQALCDVVLTIVAIAEHRETKTNNTITERVLLETLIKQLETLETSGYSNNNGYQLAKLYKGDLADRLNLITHFPNELFRRYEDIIDANFLYSRVHEIMDQFNKKLRIEKSNLVPRIEVNVIESFKKYPDLLLKYLFSDADRYQRAKLLANLIEETNDFHTFAHITNLFKNEGIKLNLNFKLYNQYKKKYDILISDLNFYGNSKEILLRKIKDTEFFIEFVKSGASINYSSIMEYFKKDVLKNLNIDLLNILVENCKNNGNLKVRNNYRSDDYFFADINNLFVEYLSKSDFKSSADAFNMGFSMYTIQWKNLDDHRCVFYPEWNDKLYKTIIKWIEDYFDKIPNDIFECIDTEQYVYGLCEKIISNSLTQSETDECVGKMNELYATISEYIETRKDKIKAEKNALIKNPKNYIK